MLVTLPIVRRDTITIRMRRPIVSIASWTVGDQYLSTVGVSYGQRWRNVGLECAFILFNTAFLLIGFYVFREAK